MNSLLRDVTDEKGEKAVLQQVKIDAKTDLYTIGLILYEVLTGNMRTETSLPPNEINKDIPQKLNEVILGLLEEDPSNRIPSAEKLKDELASVV
jgi:serine/threonine protein kinase